MTAQTPPYLHGRKMWSEEFKRGRATERKHGVRTELPPKRRIEKPLCVIGTGSCGTTWLSKTLKASGYDVPHECVGEHGTVSKFFVRDHSWYPRFVYTDAPVWRKAHVGERRSDFVFRSVVHLVRHPLLTVPSQNGTQPWISREWYRDAGVVSQDPSMRPSMYRDLLSWMQIVEECCRVADYTVALPKLTNDARAWRRLLMDAGLDHVPKADLPPRNSTSRNRKNWNYRDKLKWSDVDAYDARLGKSMRRLCRKLKLE